MYAGYGEHAISYAIFQYRSHLDIYAVFVSLKEVAELEL